MSTDSDRAAELRDQILELIREYHDEAFAPIASSSRGDRRSPSPGASSTSDEIVNLVDSSLDFWLTTGRFAQQFEKRFARLFGVPPRAARQLGLLGEPGRALLRSPRPSSASAGCSPATR